MVQEVWDAMSTSSQMHFCPPIRRAVIQGHRGVNHMKQRCNVVQRGFHLATIPLG